MKEFIFGRDVNKLLGVYVKEEAAMLVEMPSAS